MDSSNVGGHNVNKISYAYDTVLIADSVEKLQTFLDVVNRASEEKGLKMKRKKNGCLVALRRSEVPVCPMQIGTSPVGKVKQFQYLGVAVTENVR